MSAPGAPRRRRTLWFLGVVVLGLAGSVAWLAFDRAQLRLPQLAPVVRLSSIHADVFSLDASAIVKRGPSRILAVRFDEPVELVPSHFTRTEHGEPMTVEAWADRLHAPVVFTAGQFDEHQQHLGWLKADGEWLMRTAKPQWKALLVSGPVNGGAWAGVVDLERASENIADEYRHVVQSMMLVDETNRVRVRDTDRSACRVVVAQDRRGRVIVLVSEGAVTLGDLARWLVESELDLLRAMNLDGGVEAQLAIRTPELELALYGQYGTGSTAFEHGAVPVRYPLPAVIAVRRPQR